MKVCFAQQFHLAERMGGAEVQAWLLAVELARRGCEVSYIAESLQGRGGTSEVRDGVTIHWLPRQRYVELANLPAYYRCLRRVAPDVIIHRSTSMYTGVVGSYARRHGTPFLWICTDDTIPYRWHFLRQQQDLIRAYGSSLPKRLVLLGMALLRDLAKNHGIRLASHVATQNSIQARAFRQQFGRESLRFHSGHPLPEVLPAKDDPPVVLWVGDISLRKRPELFVELADACRDLPVRFAMICKATSGKDQARRDGIADHGRTNPAFAWLDALPLQATNEWFGRAAVYVSTSAPGGDGFPNTFVQAWLRRTPVLSFGTDPNQVLARQGLGRVVATVAEAREALQAMLAAPEADALGQRVAQYARARHSIGSVADHVLAMFGPEAEAPAVALPDLAARPSVIRGTGPARAMPQFRRRTRRRRLQELEAENLRLRRLVADLALEKQQLAERIAR